METLEPAHLQRCALFGGLTENQIAGILPLVERGDFEAGEVILAEGKVNDKIYFILEGSAAASRGGLPLWKVGEGDTFGEMEVIDVMPCAVTVRALTAVRVMSISNKALHEIYKTDIHAFALIIMNLARDISRRLRLMDSRLIGESPAMEWN